MATHDYVIANGTGSAVRSDINNVLAAIVSTNSASSEPSTKYAYQFWADTNTGYLKIRNAANNAWIQLFKLDGTDICRLTGSTNNTITTVIGANAIQGEANLTCDGTNLTIGSGSSSVDHSLKLTADTGTFTLKHNRGSHKLELSDSDGTGDILAIDTSGNVKINDGDLVIGTAGHGIDFSANSHATGMSSETLDSYEEGTFTPTYNFSGGTGTFTYDLQIGRYTKIGNRVFYTMIIGSTAHTGTSVGNLRVAGLPYAVKSDSPSGGSVFFISGGNFTSDYGVVTQLNTAEQIEFYRQIQSTGSNHASPDTSNVNKANLFIKVEGAYYTEG